MSNLLTGLKSDVRLDSEEAHYTRLVEQCRELEAKVERLEMERDDLRNENAQLAGYDDFEDMMAALEQNNEDT